ncbi:unnamed protein product, partial [Adineta steineri]
MNISYCKYLISRSISSIINHKVKEPQFGLLFDVDVKPTGEFRIPTIFVTNASNELHTSKAAKLTQILEIPILPEQVIVAHSPLKMYTEFHKKHCLISGQGPIADIAKNLGFTKVTTIEQLCDA